MNKQIIISIISIAFSLLTLLVFFPEVMFLGVAFGVCSLILGLNRLKHTDNKILSMVSVIITVMAAGAFVISNYANF